MPPPEASIATDRPLASTIASEPSARNDATAPDEEILPIEAADGAAAAVAEAARDGTGVAFAISVEPGVGTADGTADGDGLPHAATRIATIAAITTAGAMELERIPGARFGRLDRSIIQRYAAGSYPDATKACRRPCTRAAAHLDGAQSAGMGSMKAAIRDRYGSPDVVRVEEIERPEPEPDEVLVRVVAASVNRGDLDGIVPKPQFVRLFIGLRTPRNPRIGLDVAGVVEAVGASVTRFAPGDRVFADLYTVGQGAFAEYVAAPERVFVRIPDELSFEDAATLPHAAILALQGLRRRDGTTIKPGDRVLIDGASGNVGPFAIQIAKSMGAQVTGVCRTSKVDFVRAVGADRVIDYTATDYTRTGDRYDWILAADSHHSVLQVRNALKPHGRYVTLGGDGRSIVSSVALGAVVTAATDKWAGLMLWWKPFEHADVETLLRMIAEGHLRPFIDRRYRLDEIVDALRWVDDGHAQGKVVVQVS